MKDEIVDDVSTEEKKKEEPQVNMQTKVNMEVTISRNFNKIMFAILDEPIKSTTEEEFRKELHRKAEILREEAEKELKLIGSFPK